MGDLFHPGIMTSLIRATNYHKNAMNKLISRLIARCDITLALVSLAVLLDGAPSRLLRMQKALAG